MTNEDIALERAAAWPEQAQLTLLRAALEIEQEQEQGIYRLSDAERTDLREAEGEFDRGEVASASQVEETFERLRGK